MVNDQSKNNGSGVDYSELVQFISDKFDESDKNLDRKLEEKLESKLEEKLESKLEEKLDKKLEEKLDKKLEEKLEAKLKGKADKADIDRVLARIALLGDKIDDIRSDQSKTQRQVDKHEKWHHQTAEKIGIVLGK
jgi:hypothetical protein